MKNNLKNRPRPPKPLCPIGTVYEQFLEAFEAELRQKLEGCLVDRRKVSGNLSLYNKWEGRLTIIKEVLGIEGEAK